MPKGKGYNHSNREGRKSGSGYPGRGAASKSSKVTPATGTTKEGTLQGAHNLTQVYEMRDDALAGVKHKNPYPGKMGGYHGPGRS